MKKMTIKSQSSASKHTAQLSAIVTLVCHPAEQRKVIISTVVPPENREGQSKPPKSNYPSLPQFNDYFPTQILGYTSLSDDQDEPTNSDGT